MSIEDIVLVVTVREGIRIRTLKLKLPRFRIAWNLMEAAQAWAHAGCEDHHAARWAATHHEGHKAELSGRCSIDTYGRDRFPRGCHCCVSRGQATFIS